jgi:hypothetical protein
MKTILLLLCSVGILLGQSNPFDDALFLGSLSATISEGGGDCNTIQEQNTLAVASYLVVGQNAATYYQGQFAWDSPTNVTICKISIALTATGVINTNTYTIQIWTYTTPNMVSLVATSDPVTGDNTWATNTVDFVFTSGAALTGGITYCLALSKSQAPSVSNYLRAHTTAAGGLDGSTGNFDVSGIRQSSDTFDLKLVIYKQ